MMILPKLKINLNIFFSILLFSLQFNFAEAQGIIHSEDHYDIITSDFYENNSSHKFNLKIDLKNGSTILYNDDQNVAPKISLAQNSANIVSFNAIWPKSNRSTILIPINYSIVNSNIKPSLNLNIEFILCNKGCLFKSHTLNINLPLSESKYSQYNKSYNLIYLLFIAMLGGLILNIMPCVLPVISLKVLSLMQLAHTSKKKIKLNIVAIVMGIVSCFCILALLMIVVKSAGRHFGLGLTFQEPMFLIFIVICLTIFASASKDHIYVDLPFSIKNFLSKHSDESKIIGSYFSGMFATLLATPCTAPFLGTAVSIAFTLSNFYIVLIFLFIGLGMALPFLFFLIFPNILNTLRLSQKFTKYAKKAVLLFIYCTLLWILWILSNQLNIYAVIALFLILLLLKFILELKWKNKFLKFKNIIFCILLFNAFILPHRINGIYLNVDKIINSEWQIFSLENLKKYISNNNLVLVDVTAEWCLTCKYNKTLILDSHQLFTIAKDFKIILLRADYTNKDPEITSFLAEHNRHGIPFNVIFSKKYPKGIVLPVLLKYSDIVNAAKRAR